MPEKRQGDEIAEFLDALERFLLESQHSATAPETRWCVQGNDELDLFIWELLNIEEKISLGEIIDNLAAKE